jgi:hypothetical protein
MNWGVDRFTDFHLDLQQPKVHFFSGDFEASRVTLLPKSGGPALVSASFVQAHFGALDLLFRDLSYSSLAVEDLQIYIAEDNAADSTDPEDWLKYLRWLPQNIEISSLYFILAAQSTWVYELQDISGKRKLNASYFLSAKSSYNRQELLVNLELLTEFQKGQLRGLNLRGKVRAPGTGSSLNFNGQLLADNDSFDYDLTVDYNGAEIENFSGVFQQSISLEGTLEVVGRLQGNTQGFTITDAKIALDNMPYYGLHAGGSLHNSFSGDSELALRATGQMNSLDYLVEWIDLDLTSLGTAQVSATISGPLNRPAIKNLLINTAHEDGLSIKVSGAMTWDIDDKVTPLQADSLQLDLHAPSLDALGQWLDPPPYDLGPWRASATLARSGDGLRVSNIVADAGTGEPLQLHAQGDIAQILDPGSPGLPGIKGIDLTISGYAGNIAVLAEVAGWEIPEIQSVQGQLRLSGSGNSLAFGQAQFAAVDEGIKAQLTELSGRVVLGDDWALSGISARLWLEAEDTSHLSRFLDLEVPTLGPLKLDGVLTQEPGALKLDKLSAHLGRENSLEVFTQGGIDNLLNVSGVSLRNRFSGLNSGELLHSFFDAYEYDYSPPVLGGSFLLETDAEQWHISNIEVSSTPESPIQLSAVGRVDDLLGTARATVDLGLRIDDPATLNAISGFDIDAVSATAKLQTTTNQAELSLEGFVGGTEISSAGKLSFADGKITRLDLGLSSPHLYLEDFDLQAREEASGELYKPAEQLGESLPDDVLQRIIEDTAEFPMDIKVLLEKVSGNNVEIGKVDVHLSSEDNRLTLRKFSAYYGRTAAELRGLIDLKANPPIFSLGGVFLAINMNHLIADLGIDSDISGTLTVRSGLTASGSKSEELLASLDGSFSLALENAEIAGAAYDVLATDFLAWIYTGAATESSTHIECTRGNFALSNGRATSDNLYMETRRMIAKGKGSVNLVNNTLDLSFTPKSKTRIGQVSSAIQLSGDMADPTVSLSPLSTYANLYSEFLLVVPNFFMKLFRVERKKTEGTCLAPLYD